MNHKLNIIFIGPFLYPHGYAATKRKQQFLDYLKHKKNKVRVIITLKRSRGHELNETKGVHQGIPYEAIGANVKPGLFLPFTFLIFLIRAFHRLSKYRSLTDKNIIVSFGLNFDTLFPVMYAKLIGYKIVFDIVEDFETVSKPKTRIETLKLWFIKTPQKLFIKNLASGISVNSRFLEARLSSFNGLLELIPISASNLNLELNKTTHKEFHFLYSGTYGEKEGLEILITAFAKYLRTTQSGSLIFTGKCPERIKQIVKQKIDNPASIKYTGWLEDNEYYQQLKNADVHLMTRTNTDFSNAGFPYKLGEYLASKNPVICTDVSDISLYLIHMESAIILPPEDADSLYDAMLFLSENSMIGREIGIKGYEVCKQHFNPEKNSNKFFSLLNSA